MLNTNNALQQAAQQIRDQNATAPKTPVSNKGTLDYIEAMQKLGKQDKEDPKPPTPPTTPKPSGSKNSSSGTVSKKPIWGSGSSTTTPAPTPTPVVPDTTVQDSYKEAMEAANERLKQAYEFQQGQLASARDNALREAYIKQQMVERGYPEQLSAAGINGGAAQGLIARNNADYAKQRTNIQGNFLNNLGAAGQTYQQGILQNNENFLKTMAEYQQSLDEMRRKWELEQLEKSGLLNIPTTINRASSGLSGLFGGTTPQKLTPQQYLENLRANYGNLFK